MLYGKVGNGRESRVSNDEGKALSCKVEITGHRIKWSPSFVFLSMMSGFTKCLFSFFSPVFTYPENGSDDFRDQAKNTNHQVSLEVTEHRSDWSPQTKLQVTIQAGH
jgi:hypothetical protein